MWFFPVKGKQKILSAAKHSIASACSAPLAQNFMIK